MPLQRWGLTVVVAGWLTGIILAQYLPLLSILWVLGICGSLTVVVAIVGTWLAYRHGRFPRHPRRLLALWFVAAVFVGLVRLTLAQAQATDAIAIQYMSGQRVTLQGTITSEPDERARGTLVSLLVTRIQPYRGAWQSVTGTVQLFAPSTPFDPQPQYGDTVQIAGTTHPATATTPLGMIGRVTATRVHILQSGGENPLLRWLFGIRETLAAAIRHSLPAPEAALAIGIALGLKTPELRQRIDQFTRTGTIHLIVTSGLKVTVVGSIIAGVVRWLPLWLQQGIILLGIATYVIISGMGPAAIRAGIMGAILVIGQGLGRDYDVFSALAATAFIMSAISPDIIWDVGFQLSTVGTFGIAILAPRLHAPLLRLCHYLPAGPVIAEVLAATAAAQIATLPIVALSFGIISTISLLANLLLVPFLAIFLIVGLAQGIIGAIVPAAGDSFGLLTTPFWQLANASIVWCSQVPGAAFTVTAMPGWLTPVWVIALALVPVGWRRPSVATHQQQKARPLPKQIQAGIAICLVLALFIAGMGSSLLRQPPLLTISLLDLGSTGTATIIQVAHGATILVDGGSDGPLLLNQVAAILPIWQHTIDTILVTTPDKGHIQGLMTIVARYHIGQVIDGGVLHPDRAYAAWFTTIQNANIPLHHVQQGTSLPLGSMITADILAPASSLVNNVAANTVIWQLNALKMHMLFVGDATNNEVQAALPSTLAMDIVQVAQQPQEKIVSGSTAANVIAITQPKLFLISPSSHPPPKHIDPLLATLMDDPLLVNTSDIVRSSTIGTVTILVDETHWWTQV